MWAISRPPVPRNIFKNSRDREGGKSLLFHALPEKLKNKLFQFVWNAEKLVEIDLWPPPKKMKKLKNEKWKKMKSVQIAQNGEKNGRKLVLWPPRPLNLLKIIFVFMTPQIEVKEDYIDGGYAIVQARLPNLCLYWCL